jgi:elongation factor P hydroxylase
MLNTNLAVEMNRVTFNKKEVIQQYVAWLYENYPDVPKWTSIKALDNDEKKMLEERCEGVGNQVMSWIEEHYPNIWKITSVQMKALVELYKTSEGIEFHDKRYTLKNLDNSLA